MHISCYRVISTKVLTPVAAQSHRPLAIFAEISVVVIQNFWPPGCTETELALSFSSHFSNSAKKKNVFISETVHDRAISTKFLTHIVYRKSSAITFQSHLEILLKMKKKHIYLINILRFSTKFWLPGCTLSYLVLFGQNHFFRHLVASWPVLRDFSFCSQLSGHLLISWLGLVLWNVQPQGTY